MSKQHDSPDHPHDAFSYIRFSSKIQELGDSIRRQTAGAASWVEANAERLNVRLDTTLKIDRGISAFKGLNADLGSLGEFLKMIESGRVKRGSYLIVESLDRLTRDDVDEALPLLLGMTNKGVRIVQLSPVEMIYSKPVDPMKILMMVMELMRGNSESAVKSQRVGKAWDERKRRAREGAGLLGGELPYWVCNDKGTLRLIPGAAAAVRRIFELSSAGYGSQLIVRQLVKEEVPPFGRVNHWSAGHIVRLFGDRRLIGELQPRSGRWPNVKPDGPPVPNYFPRVISDDTFHSAQAAIAARNDKPGRISETHVGLFSGLIRSALDGGTYYVGACTWKPKGDAPKRRIHSLKNTTSLRGAESISFPLAPFEEALLSALSEVDPASILETAPPDERMALQGELGDVASRIADIEKELLAGGSTALARVVRGLEERYADISRRLGAAEQRAARPVGESWPYTQSLLAALREAKDPMDTRIRLKAAISRVVQSVHLLIVRRKRDRLAAVQLRFVGSPHVRTHLILSVPIRRNGRGGWWHKVVTHDAGMLDLREEADVAAMSRQMEAIDLVQFVSSARAGEPACPTPRPKEPPTEKRQP